VSAAGPTESEDQPLDAVVPSCAAQRTVEVLENIEIARQTYRLRLDDPDIARAILPGQFLMVRAGGATDPLLGRPFALYDVARDSSGSPVAVDVVYVIAGRGTAALSERRPGDRLRVWGPLGNGFGAAPVEPAVFVAGGIGQTPFLALGRWWLGQAGYGGDVWCDPPTPSLTMLYGVRTAALAAGVEDFRSAGVAVELATDDGSAGHHGFVTDLLLRRLERGERPGKIVACGPWAMMAAVARLTERYDVECDVSLENHMACGFGACFSCVAPIRQAGGAVDLRRVCVEGPVFPARVVDWSRPAH
jgi:dihydroorotate dehydrogenase electron transfer subunit